MRAPAHAHVCAACARLSARFACAAAVDYYSVQALLFQDKDMSLFQQTRLFFKYRSRIAD